MAPVISVFNNKGGVGKTTYLFHIAHLLAGQDKTILLVDLDSQCNLSTYCLKDKALTAAWAEDGNSIYRVVEPIYRGLGDFKQLMPISFNAIYPTLYLTPGDIALSNFEDRLGDSWNAARGGSEPDIRVQSALHRYIRWASDAIGADLVLVDLGPNLGALNRAVLGSSDYFIIPMSPDLFSIRGTENLGNKLLNWNDGWQQCREAWETRGNGDIDIPTGAPKFVGYVKQQHNIRNNVAGMTKGWQIFGNQVEGAIQRNIIDKLSTRGQVFEWGKDDLNWHLGNIPNLHSLVPYSLKAKKPVFDCTGRDGLVGSHVTKARKSRSHYEGIVNRILQVVG
ncbi:TPA: ParA family protein [Serratia marcescens]|uniref:ParA family protein n=1 Tax=Serratia TaxID=613 RepID=UPI000E2A3D2A|nr:MULTISPECIES: ParA family protein [Serratia]MBH2638256.1 ParA family protein [Serratia ureilytica]MBH2933817.1 ParA family protein [Serratia marcescens]